MLIDRHSRGRWIREIVPGEGQEIGRSKAAEVFRASDWLIIQYSPFAFGPGGFAPWVLRLLRGAIGTRAAVMVHETYVDWGTGRQRVMSAWQRLQLRDMLAQASVVLISTDAWRSTVAPHTGRAPVHLGVGSNLPDMRVTRQATRERLGISGDQLVIGSLSTGHDSALPGHVAAAVEEACRRRPGVVYLNLGATAPRTSSHAAMTLHPGWLPASSLAQMISAVDVFVAPFSDGASTRRTSLIASLQHSVAVVSTDGPHADEVFRTPDSGVLLASVTEPEEFAHAVGALAESATLRGSLGSAARRCYEQRFAWPVIAERLMIELAQREPATGMPRFGRG